MINLVLERSLSPSTLPIIAFQKLRFCGCLRTPYIVAHFKHLCCKSLKVYILSVLLLQSVESLLLSFPCFAHYVAIISSTLKIARNCDEVFDKKTRVYLHLTRAQ